MVLAGAGSGKTRVLVHRIERLIDAHQVPGAEILAVTFTNKAAGEMRYRLRRLLGRRADPMWIGTFHATCARLLRQHSEYASVSRDFTIFDDDDQMKLAASIIKQLDLGDAITPRSVVSVIDRAKNQGRDPAKIPIRSYADELVRKIYPTYRKALRREDALDFNDLLLEVIELARHEHAGPVLAALFSHVLVDEFQDTNLIQYELVRYLSRRTHNLCVVGDDDQSIYSWRGAEPRNLLEFDRDFPGAEVVKLEQNYRSTSIILASANAVIAENIDRHEKRLWTDRDGGEPVLWEEADDDRAEADFIARAARGLVEQEGLDYGDIAILYRTHAQSRMLEELLRAHRIDYRIVGGVSFFQRKEIKDIRSYIRLVANPSADTALSRIVNVPTRGIGKTTLDRVRNHARGHELSLLEAARRLSAGIGAGIDRTGLRSGARKNLAGFVDVIDGLKKVADAGASVAESIIQAVERSGYRERLEAEDTPQSRDRLGNLSELVSMATDFDDETQGAGTLAEFEERISLASANDSADGRGTALVTMMTIHAAKGLEFPVVFVCGMEDGLFPSLRERDAVDERRALEEERRLAYVAFTRAMNRLVLTSARVRRQWGELRLNRPSRFIDAVPKECIAIREKPRPAQVSAPFRRRRRPVHDELDQRTPYQDVPEIDVSDPQPSDPGVGAGSTVAHASFGTGRVIDARGQGRDRKLLIQFPGVGLKTILARYVVPSDT